MKTATPLQTAATIAALTAPLFPLYQLAPELAASWAALAASTLIMLTVPRDDQDPNN